MTELEKYYNKFNEEHRLTTRHGLVEFNTSISWLSTSPFSFSKLELLRDIYELRGKCFCIM